MVNLQSGSVVGQFGIQSFQVLERKEGQARMARIIP